MAIDERRVSSIVAEVLERLEGSKSRPGGSPAGEPLGVHHDLETAVAAAQAKLKAEIELELAKTPTATWIERLDRAGIPCGPINNIAQALAHPQVEARDMLVTVEDPVAGTLRLAGNPLKLSAFAEPATPAPAPELDADRRALLRELGIEE